jgi:polyisoprenoid-binding protein YceI
MIALPRAGTHRLGPAEGSVLVYAKRRGVAATFGHDLTLEVTRWEATALVDDQDLSRSSVNASFDARSLEVKEATGGAIPLSDRDRADIKKSIAEKVLLTDRHPEITFESTGIEVIGQDSVTVAGNLVIVGMSRLVRVPLNVERTDSSVRVAGSVVLVQSDWGIKPFSTMMGALKIRDEIEVRVDVRVPAA